MRVLLTIVLFATINCVLSKNNVKSLTESLGQEVIEIGTPIKELPPDLEEEPSAENDEDDKPTTLTIPAGTKKDFKKTATSITVDTRRKNKDSDKTTTMKQDDEEAKIEKELAEIYKDNIDYKSDSSEVFKEVTAAKAETDGVSKPVARVRGKTFKFQPDLDNRAEVERFRTSVDDISCDKKQMKMEVTGSPYQPDVPGSANENTAYYLFCMISFISAIFLM